MKENAIQRKNLQVATEWISISTLVGPFHIQDFWQYAKLLLCNINTCRGLFWLQGALREEYVFERITNRLDFGKIEIMPTTERSGLRSKCWPCLQAWPSSLLAFKNWSIVVVPPAAIPAAPAAAVAAVPVVSAAAAAVVVAAAGEKRNSHLAF